MSGLGRDYVFGSNPLERVPGLRADEEWVRSQHQHPRAKYLLLRELAPAVVTVEETRLHWTDRASALDGSEAAEGEFEPILLGLWDEVPHFAVPAHPRAVERLGEAVTFGEARAVGAALPAAEAGIFAQARTLLDWHGAHRFCGRCGAPTRVMEGGARRHCDACGMRLYPSISPSMIVVVGLGDRCLLAHRPTAPANRFSCLAGFVEAGESIEDAVAREVWEECEVSLSRVRYHSSQAWPFPASLMIGCIAEAASEHIRADGTEIGEANWFSLDEVRSALAGTNERLVLPDRVAIARHLIQAWADGERAE